MSRHRQLFAAPLGNLSESDGSGDGTNSGIEDSLRGTTAFDRHAPVASHPFTRPAQQPIETGTYAFAATPDSALPPTHRPPYQGEWHSPRAPTVQQTPEAGPSTYQHLSPPRIERQAPAARLQAHTLAPSFPASFAPADGGRLNLFTRPVAAPTLTTGVNAFGSPTEMSMSNSFSFAPRGSAVGAGGAMFAVPAARGITSGSGQAPLFAAPNTPVRPANPTTATTTAANMFFNAIPARPSTSASSTNLDAAALQAERRIREARAASRNEEPPRRSVSFSPTVTTPQNAGQGAMYHALAPPAPVNRAAAAHNQARQGHVASHADSSISHLGRDTRAFPHMGRDPSYSMSTDASFARPTATRLFTAPTASTGVAPTLQQQMVLPSPVARSTQAVAMGGASEPDPEQVSWMEDPSTSISHSQSAPTNAPPAPVRLRKWDGSTTLVPSYLVSDSPETVIEEHLFDHDTIDRFDVSSLHHKHSSRVLGEQASTTLDVDGAESDVVLAILETQLGLKGLHGWYGFTYRNPRHRHGEKSRKRRRSGSADGSTSFSSHGSDGEEEPIVVYDTFVVLPSSIHNTINDDSFTSVLPGIEEETR
ncbi:hypothetical protein PHBOTO_002710 [Pseudozyma hubeiensis]|nr:hypothetical protein PHBOTO_002710 [Pseudozyma hubeiensis]